MKLRIARSAVRDLDGIWVYIAAKESIEIAERMVSSLTSRLSFLAKNSSAARDERKLFRRAGVVAALTG